MENVLIGRDGSARIRPALRLMLDDHFTNQYHIVGSFEQFVNHQGGKSILFAVKDLSTNEIEFVTADYDGDRYTSPVQADNTPTWSSDITYIKYLQINNRIYCLNNGGVDEIAVFEAGGTDAFIDITPVSDNRPTTPTLALDGSLAAGDFNYGFFVTITNEFGESKPSELSHITADKKWTGWASGDSINISGLPAAGLWNLYFVFWSSDAPVPVEGVLVKEGGTGSTFTADTTALLTSSSAGNHFLPSPADENFANPPVAAQGLVAADRLILVNDFENRARIRWSSNSADAYGNFSPGKGGGYKTLSSGDLQIPYTVQLWQNPQSVDTLTVLCSGLDGYHACYYMSPASVTSQMEETQIMAFEETTATPGTVSPYGCEVFNNALYHPLDDQLMKSTANNYNINHKTISEAIANKWLNLENKRNIVSSQYDGRLYYIVHNPDGEKLEPGCLGNEIWVCDVGSGEGTPWSRFLIQAASLRKIESGGKLYMGVVRPEGIYRLDELAWLDEWSGGEKAIPWFFQSNTQGANSARDAWSHLQQIGVTFGNAYGTIRYGIQSWTVDGKPLDLHKVYRQPNTVDFAQRPLPFDHEDLLQVQRGLQQWFFSAGSVLDPNTGEVLPSYGQISSVLYRFAPISVNVAYEYGSVQTYEYAQADAHWTARSSINGVPIPVLDPRRP